MSSWKTRLEKSTVATKRNRSRTASVSTTATASPGPTIAMRSTRSASSTNGFIESSTNATVPVCSSSPVSDWYNAVARNGPGAAT